MSHPDFAVLTVSWELALQSLAGWLAQHHPEVGPTELERQHIRGWLVEVRVRHSSNMPEDGSPGCGTSAGGWRPRARPTA